jgi:hypothetical protein
MSLSRFFGGWRRRLAADVADLGADAGHRVLMRKGARKAKVRSPRPRLPRWTRTSPAGHTSLAKSFTCHTGRRKGPGQR